MTKQILFYLLIPILVSKVHAQNLLTSGDMESQGSWDTAWVTPPTHDVSLDFGFSDTRASYGKAGALRVSTQAAASSGLLNFDLMIYHPVVLTPGKTYFIGGAFRDITEFGVANFWSEVAISPYNPKDSLKGGAQFIMAINTWRGCGGRLDYTYHDASCRYQVIDPEDSTSLIPNPYFHVPDSLSGDQIYFLIIETGTWNDSNRERTIDYLIDEMGVYNSATVNPEALYVYDSMAAYVEPELSISLPEKVDLNVYPNPLSPGQNANIDLVLTEKSDVTLTVVDLIGRRVNTVYRGTKSAGQHQLSLSTSEYSQGIYFLELRVNETLTRRKLVIR